MTFREYIKARRITDTPAGEFTKDARADGRLRDVQSWPELRRYLQKSGATPAAIAAGHIVWKGYRAALKAQGAQT
ncbi:hypothetical protein [uncultured Phenylobacterium sp.]|uniref:hypothetical protein n=1 Tax=uncultured Phenylobacterium sp. TaxID=349273 RepID=UPI0025FD7600|nr:hypothetical protein [uncultured Phenylobacterium sp.]